jgi:hypothetical protein
VAYPDGTFAFSNSEPLIEAVIDRKARIQAAQTSAASTGDVLDAGGSGTEIEPGLGDLPKLHSVESRLPEDAVARLFVDARRVGRVLAATPRPAKPSEARLMAMLERYLAAIDYAGTALVWNDRTIVLHMAELLDPTRVDPWLRRWAGDARLRNPALTRVPSTALAIACGHVDAVALYDAICGIVPDLDQPKLANIETALTGLLLGQDLRTQILPRLGPGVLAYLDTPSERELARAGSTGPTSSSSSLFPLVVVLSLENAEQGASRTDEASRVDATVRRPNSASVAGALENALRSILALAAMDEKRNQGRSRITTRVVAGTAVATLDSPIPFAYAVDAAGSRLILGTSADSVARFVESSSDSKAGERFTRLRTEAFSGDETFCCVDLAALAKLAEQHRDRVVQILAARKDRPAADVERDLTQLLALARLFDAAFITSRIEPDATSVQRRVGLIVHGNGGK